MSLRMPRRRFAALGTAAVAVTVAATMSGTPASAAPPEGQIRNAGGATAVAGSYIVVFKDAAVARGAVATTAKQMTTRYGGTVARTYSAALRGFQVTGSATAARRIAANRAVAYVEQDHMVFALGTQPDPPSWGLDRIDQRDLPLNSSYTFPSEAGSVHAYIIDTGIRTTHTTFGGRAVSGFDAVDGGAADDCHGHGTHVAGTVGGAQYGVAKSVQLVAVRVLNCQGQGTNAQVVGGIDWVTQNAIRPAVANMSLGGGANQAIDDAVRASINSRVTYAIAAGNGNIIGQRIDACTQSPARVPEAITVGATTINDAAASFSNFGTCVDILAPGVDITSSWATSDTATNTISGTSMATPHVAGAAALVLESNPGATAQEVRDTLVNNASVNKISNVGTGTPNRLLFVGGGGQPGPDFSLSVTPTSGSTAPGGSVTATVNTQTTTAPAQTVTFSASGLPSGANASFNPASVTSGGSSTLTIATSASTPAGTYPVTVTGTAASGTHSATFTLTVTGTGGGCSGSNGADVNIPDAGAAVFSPIAIAGCGRNAGAASTVEVHIVHTYRGDLRIDLVAPDGTAYRLKNINFFDSADNVNATYTVNLSSEVADGNWRLRVQDFLGGDTGFIDTWTLTV
jgi:subtilisin family serine protease